jgi:Putative peptidoglycan binding domain
MLTLSSYSSQNTKGITGLSNQLCSEAVKMGFLAPILNPKISTDDDSLVHLYLHPRAVEQLNKVAAEVNEITVSTCYRTLAQQFVLKQNRSGLVAPVGRSDHGSGKSLDITNYSDILDELKKYDFQQSYPDNDPFHLDCGDIPDNRCLTIKAFQQLANRNGINIAVDGCMGAGTMRALANAPANGYPIASVPRWLSMGDVGKDVAKYQLILRDAKLYSGAYDGIYGAGMQKAVIDFQNRYKLDITGIIGDITRGRLCDYPDIEVHT